MSQAVAAPSVIINNEPILIVPNSLKYDAGEGEQKVRSASGGGSSVEPVVTIDVESKIGKVKFDAYLTTDLDAKISDWKNRAGRNSISFVQTLGVDTFNRSFSQMSCVNAIERDASAEGVTSIEFEGGQMSSS